MDVRVSSSPWVVVRTGNTRGRSMVPEWPRESPGPTFLGSRNIDNFQSLSFAKFRGVQPCAQLTRRADGLGELDPGGIWGDLKWSRATAVDVTPHRVGQNQSRRPIKRTRPRTRPRTSHGLHVCIPNISPLCDASGGVEDYARDVSAPTEISGTWAFLRRKSKLCPYFFTERAGSI